MYNSSIELQNGNLAKPIVTSSTGIGLNVLSLFDGMSCGQLALQKAGIKVNKYYASEIDKHAITVTMANFPNTIQIGDVTKVFAKDLDKIDLIIGGSPCQGFSFAGKGLNFEDPRSKLFFEFVRLVNECNPKWFFLENVRMKKEHELVISQYMKVAPIEINSALLSAQNRVRLYWTNINQIPWGLFGDMITDIPQPKDKGILLKDVLETDVEDKYYLSDKMLKYFENKETKKMNIRKEYDKASCFTAGGNSGGLHSDMTLICVDTNGRINETKTGTIPASYAKGADNYSSRPFILETQKDNLVIVAERGRQDENGKWVQQFEQNNTGKTNTLTSVQKDNLVMQLNPSTESNGCQPYQQNRVYDTNGISPALMAQMSSGTHAIFIPEATKKGYVEIEAGQCFDFENPNSETRRGRKMEVKSNCLMAKETDFMQFTNEGKIRRLTPTECERLQTVPDGYTNYVSDTQRYRMLGNGWTVDVIAYIFSFIKKCPNYAVS